MPWIRCRSDGVKFIQAYLNKFSEIKERLTVKLPVLASFVEENDIVTVKNGII